MFRGLERRRPDDCVSDLRLDGWVAGEASREEQRAIAAHLASCARCHARSQTLVRERDVFLSSAPARASGFTGRSPVRAQWLLIASSLGAAAALAGAYIGLPDAQFVQHKGGDELGFYVKRGERVQRGRSGERVLPGDQLRFVYSSTSVRYLAIMSLDGAGNASVYFPPGERAAPLPAGDEVALPFSVVLDGVLGRERIVALFCESAVPIAALREELGRRGELGSAPAGCESRALTLHKEARTQ